MHAAHAMLQHATPSDALRALRDTAAQRSRLPGAYGGEVEPAEAWDFLSSHPDAMLVDVRTQPEWQFTGQPDLSRAAGTLVSLSWKHYPSMALNAQFEQQLRESGATENTPLFFLCKTGGRSLDAAIAMTEAGFAHCFNITHGYDGDADDNRQRGHRNGWRATQLPWGQP